MSNNGVPDSDISISVCDVMKDNTSKIIKKLEAQIPFSAQHYSDLYTLFLHSVDDIFGTCYLAEKQFFDRLGLDQGALKSFKMLSDQFTNAFLTQIEMTSSLQKSQLELQKNLLHMYEQYLHSLVDSYWKSVGDLNKFLGGTKKT
ncbi:MAG TPA: hypothetical protein VNK44_02640 [Candidatus Nitrosotenuis sp.]|nr:hypothetical protein [Candidatus Nitrosotenuis sp.]